MLLTLNYILKWWGWGVVEQISHWHLCETPNPFTQIMVSSIRRTKHTQSLRKDQNQGFFVLTYKYNCYSPPGRNQVTYVSGLLEPLLLKLLHPTSRRTCVSCNGYLQRNFIMRSSTLLSKSDGDTQSILYIHAQARVSPDYDLNFLHNPNNYVTFLQFIYVNAQAQP